jgi:hypothetical protein
MSAARERAAVLIGRPSAGEHLVKVSRASAGWGRPSIQFGIGVGKEEIGISAQERPRFSTDLTIAGEYVNSGGGTAALNRLILILDPIFLSAFCG